MNGLQLIFHLTATITFAYGIYYDVYNIVFPPEFRNELTEFAGRLKYLTFLNLVLQLIYYSLSSLNDIIGTSSKIVKENHGLQTIRDYLFGSLVFPIAMFVALTFWALWAIDRELVFPAALDAFFPPWLNHIMHTSIVPFAIIELLFVPKVFPNRSQALKGTSAFMLGYIAWVFFIAYHTSFWVYPILEVLSWPLRILFIIACATLAGLLYLIGESLHFIRWGKALVSKVPSKSATRSQTRGPIKGGSENKRQSKKE